MTKCHAVIGAGFGDEGKGRLTDALVHKLISANPNTTVVRFNGGAQAGHTVQVGNARHVFHHWSSGALAGAITHLGPEFVCHPMMFAEETHELANINARLVMRVDPSSRITTPYDIMINQALELHRSKTTGRHGSCGMGFGETIERCLRPDFSLRLSDVGQEKTVRDILYRIRSEYVKDRCEELGVPIDLITNWLYQDQIVERFMRDLSFFNSNIHHASSEALRDDDAVVFEGAQGLELDEDMGSFPHVTRSKTGLPGIETIMNQAGLVDLDATYITRIYTTRHGAGPMSFEQDVPDHVNLVDPTNHDNAHQGSLRFAPINPDRLQEMMSKDILRAPLISTIPSWAVTCLDQVPENSCPCIQNGVVTQSPVSDILAQLTTRAPLVFQGHGPARKDGRFCAPSTSYSAKMC